MLKQIRCLGTILVLLVYTQQHALNPLEVGGLLATGGGIGWLATRHYYECNAINTQNKNLQLQKENLEKQELIQQIAARNRIRRHDALVSRINSIEQSHRELMVMLEQVTPSIPDHYMNTDGCKVVPCLNRLQQDYATLENLDIADLETLSIQEKEHATQLIANLKKAYAVIAQCFSKELKKEHAELQKAQREREQHELQMALLRAAIEKEKTQTNLCYDIRNDVRNEVKGVVDPLKSSAHEISRTAHDMRHDTRVIQDKLNAQQATLERLNAQQLATNSSLATMSNSLIVVNNALASVNNTTTQTRQDISAVKKTVKTTAKQIKELPSTIQQNHLAPEGEQREGEQREGVRQEGEPDEQPGLQPGLPPSTAL